MKKRRVSVITLLLVFLALILPGIGFRFYAVYKAQEPTQKAVPESVAEAQSTQEFEKTREEGQEEEGQEEEGQEEEQSSELTPGSWYTLRPQNCITAEGEAMKTRLRVGSENKLVVIFYGGGVSTNEYTAAHPYIGVWSDTQTGFYSADTVGQIPEINRIGIGDGSGGNYFSDWSILVIPYATGDFHVGDGEYTYTDENGEEQILYHHGYQNFRSILDLAVKYIDTEPEELLITGYSAGGFAASMLAEEIMTDYFPDAGHVTVCVDSSLLLVDDWNQIASEVWQAPEHITEKLQSDNIVVDSLAALYAKYGDSITYLYIGSTRDGALSQYQAYYDGGIYRADNRNLTAYQQNLKTMVSQLNRRVPCIGIFLFDSVPYSWRPQMNRLTYHTVLSTYFFTFNLSDGVSPCTWIRNAVEGQVRSVGMDKLGPIGTPSASQS